MRILYIDCQMGIAGDMLMGALLELHPEAELFLQRFNEVGLPHVKVWQEACVRGGVLGTKVHVTIRGEEEGGEQTHTHHHHTTLRTIEQMIETMKLPEEVKKQVVEIYTLLAQAESMVHGKMVEEVHFHEVGMLDAIADITGCAWLLHELNVDRVVFSPITVGYGQVKCAHGLLPVPAPATANLLKGIPCRAGRFSGEFTTPTGAVLAKYYGDSFEQMPDMSVVSVGYGMGTREYEAVNGVRGILGTISEVEGQVKELTDEVLELRCNLDDMTGEEIGYAMEMLLENGALDVFTMPIMMKKSRPGTLFTVICRSKKKEHMVNMIFKYTTTIGIRQTLCQRSILKREEYVLKEDFGKVRVKKSSGYGVTREKLEYEDLKEVANHMEQSIGEVKKLFQNH